MITENYVSFETAKLLKEKGFDESCEQIYDGGGYLLANNCGYINEELPDDHFHALAPTHQKAMKWLREVHKVNIEIHYNKFGGNYKYLIIYKPEVLDDIRSLGFYSYYEDACEDAIKYCLKNLI